MYESVYSRGSLLHLRYEPVWPAGEPDQQQQTATGSEDCSDSEGRHGGMWGHFHCDSR